MPRKKRTAPWLDQRAGSDIWYAFWYDEQRGRTGRLSLHTADLSEATRRFAAFLVEGADIYQGATPRGNGLTCGVALDDYYREHILEHAVAKVRARDLIENLKRFFGDTPIREVDVAACRAYTKARRSGAIGGTRPRKGRDPMVIAGSDGTIRRELGVLQAAANHAVKWGRLDRSDLPRVDKPDTPVSKGVWATHEELDRLRAAAAGRVADFIEVAYYTASRARAVETLKWFQVDFNRQTINLSPPGDVVTKKRRPIVPIDPALLPTLLRLREERKNEYVLGSPSPIRKGFEWAAKRAGVRCLPELGSRPAGTFTPHVLRHSRATHLLSAGVSLWSVAKLLGDNATTVERVYGHSDTDTLRSALFGGASGAKSGA